MNTLSLAEMPAGFADPVHDAQQVFRRLLDAMSRPGRLQTVDGLSLSPPPGLSVAAAAVLLTVADADLRVWFHPAYRGDTLSRWLRFHTSARVVAEATQADWLVLPASAAAGNAWTDAHPGTDEAPHTSATLLVDAPAISDAPQLSLKGPGIEHSHTLSVDGLAAAFWHERIAREADFPRGADLVVASGHRLVAVPRSTRIAVED